MRFFRAILFTAALIVPIAVRAATVELVNGDRISGKITGRDDKSIHVNSTILGDLVLSLSSVSKIVDDSPAKGAPLTETPIPPEKKARPPEPPAAGGGPDVAGESPQPPRQLSDRGKYHGKRYMIPVAFDFIRRISSMYNLKSSFKVGLNYYNGKTDSKSGNIAFTIGRIWLMHELKLDYTQNYAESTSSAGVKSVSVDKMRTSLRYRYNVNKRMYFQSDTQYGYSRVSDIDHDYLQSFGYGWRAVQTKLWICNITPSISCQYQVVDDEDQTSSLAPTIYEEAEYKWTDTVKLRNEASAIFPVMGDSNPSFHFSVSLKNKLMGGAFISLDYLMDYDGAVTIRKNAMQQTLRASFGMDF